MNWFGLFKGKPIWGFWTKLKELESVFAKLNPLPVKLELEICDIPELIGKKEFCPFKKLDPD